MGSRLAKLSRIAAVIDESTDGTRGAKIARPTRKHTAKVD